MRQRMETKSATEFRDDLHTVLNNAMMGVPTTIQNRGKDAAVVVPVEVWEQYVRYEIAELRDLVAERGQEETSALSDALAEVVAASSPAAKENEDL